MCLMYFLGNYLESTPLTVIECNPDMDETTYIGRLHIPPLMIEEFNPEMLGLERLHIWNINNRERLLWWLKNFTSSFSSSFILFLFLVCFLFLKSWSFFLWPIIGERILVIKIFLCDFCCLFICSFVGQGVRIFNLIPKVAASKVAMHIIISLLIWYKRW